MAKMSFLTTTDNPYNPLTHFDQWLEFDEEKGYNSCSYLARIAPASSNLSLTDYLECVEDAIDEIVSINILGIVTNNKVQYKKVTV